MVQIADRREITDVKNLKRFSSILVNAIGMEPTRKPCVDLLPCPEFADISSISVNQPIKTSVTVSDAWPEKLAEGALIILVHSCKKYKKKDVERTALKFFKKGAKIVQSKFHNDSKLVRVL
jgi:hypothetical protein